MKKIFVVISLSLISFLSSLFIHVTPQYAVDGDACVCEHSGATGEGNNGFTCVANKSGFPIERDFCDNTGLACFNKPGKYSSKNEKFGRANGIVCDTPDRGQTAECSCKTPGKLGAGNNYYNCTLKTDKGDYTKEFHCGDASQACWNDSGSTVSNQNPFPENYQHGIRCANPAQKELTNCKCTSPKNTGDSSFKCDGGIVSNCDDRSSTCEDAPGNRVDQGQIEGELPATGIKCNAPCGTLCPPKLEKHPEPPAPPCANTNSEGKCVAIKSGLGDFDTDPGKFISKVFSILLSISGGIALLLIMRAGYRIMTARGNPEGIQQGREQLVAAIVGLLFIIFSFVILEIIGVEILRIPGITP